MYTLSPIGEIERERGDGYALAYWYVYTLRPFAKANLLLINVIYPSWLNSRIWIRRSAFRGYPPPWLGKARLDMGISIL